jgi:hypothetical protein
LLEPLPELELPEPEFELPEPELSSELDESSEPELPDPLPPDRTMPARMRPS